MGLRASRAREGQKPRVRAGREARRACRVLQESGFITRGLKRTCFPGRPHGQASVPQPVCSRCHLGTPVLEAWGHSHGEGARPRARGTWQAGGQTPWHVGLCGCSETSGPSLKMQTPPPIIRALVSATWGPAHPLLSV